MATCDAAGEVVVSKNQDVLGSKQPTVLLKTEVCAVYISSVFTNINVSLSWCLLFASMFNVQIHVLTKKKLDTGGRSNIDRKNILISIYFTVRV